MKDIMKMYIRFKQASLLFLITIASFLFMIGCERREQIAWHGRMELVSCTVKDLKTHKEPIFLTSQLKAIIGNPDYTLSPDEFKNVVQETTDHPDDLVYRLWKEYSLVRPDSKFLLRTHKPDEWRKDSIFLKTSIWVYDETRHFNSPLPPQSIFSIPTGFKSYCFVVEESNVKAVRKFFMWKPVKVSGRKNK